MKLKIFFMYSLLTVWAVFPAAAEEARKATFAGGCFWCMEKPFEKLNGVTSVISGYMGGSAEQATYEQVSRGSTEHREAVQIVFDPDQISYPALLEHFWKNIDPFNATGQFCDRGSQYTSAIYTHSTEQWQAALKSKKQVVGRFPGRKVVTPVIAAGEFYPAEEYHQDFYKKNPERYHSYRLGCGRDARLQQLWQ